MQPRSQQRKAQSIVVVGGDFQAPEIPVRDLVERSWIKGTCKTAGGDLRFQALHAPVGAPACRRLCHVGIESPPPNDSFGRRRTASTCVLVGQHTYAT